MEVKKDILWRVYLVFIMLAVAGCFIFGKAFYIQQVEGEHWRGMSDSLHQKIVELEAERGTIYSEDGNMLSTSIPQFDVYIDFMADGLREKGGKRFKENVDSLSYCLNKLFGDKSQAEYKKLLQTGFREKDRYFLLRKKLSFREYQELRTFPLVRLGRNKSGFIADKKIIRLNPYKLLAYRTIGLLRDSNMVGLELTYDSVLSGSTGKRLVRFIAGGASIPVDDYEIEPENGKDITTTLDVNIQDITENALLKMMIGNEAQHGCAIVMEVKTGKIKAIANLGRGSDGNYTENYNYAITPSEPGSTFKLATMLAVIEDGKASMNTPVNLELGQWQVYGRKVYDSERHGLTNVSLKEAFEHSSNVGMAKMAWMHYGNNPKRFIGHLEKLGMSARTGIDLKGEISPVIFSPGSRYWSNTTLPWMAFGYNLTVSPLQVLTLYNAVANNGKMMRPYLVNEISKDGKVLKSIEPQVVNDSICSSNTLRQLKACLEGVVTNGTARGLRNNSYSFAGKTGTALVANGKRGYADKIYQSSFAGYFPADDPKYSVIVVIKNKPHAAKFYGAAVAGPVFREIADKVYSLKVSRSVQSQIASATTDTGSFYFAGYTKDVQEVAAGLEMKMVNKNDDQNRWTKVHGRGVQATALPQQVSEKYMPSLVGMGLKDAIYLCENNGLKVMVRGKGKVVAQSIEPGQKIAKRETISIQLN